MAYQWNFLYLKKNIFLFLLYIYIYIYILVNLDDPMMSSKPKIKLWKKENSEDSIVVSVSQLPSWNHGPSVFVFAWAQTDGCWIMIVSSQLVLDVNKSLSTWKVSGDFERIERGSSCVKWKFHATFHCESTMNVSTCAQ